MDRIGIDVEQDEILDIVQKCIGTTERIWPTRFDGKSILIKGRWQGKEAGTLEAFSIKLNVWEVNFNEMRNSPIPNNIFEYVLCTEYISKHDLHSVYIEEKNKATNYLKCIKNQIKEKIISARVRPVPSNQGKFLTSKSKT
jgi:hypothetical protein